MDGGEISNKFDPIEVGNLVSRLAVDDAEIEALVAQRADARKAKDFAESDRIRDKFLEAGIILEDKAEGTLWRRQ